MGITEGHQIWDTFLQSENKIPLGNVLLCFLQKS